MATELSNMENHFGTRLIAASRQSFSLGRSDQCDLRQI
jgi:hypothetical protein